MLNDEVCTGNIGKIVGEIFIEKNLEERTIKAFIDFLISLGARNVPISADETLLRSLSDSIFKFIEERTLCLKIMKLFYSFSGEGKYVYR